MIYDLQNTDNIIMKLFELLHKMSYCQRDTTGTHILFLLYYALFTSKK